MGGDGRSVLDHLDNGCRLVTARVDGARSASLGVFVTAGSRHEPDDLAGASHFLEHLLFKGTDRL
ncbi:MAG TPA: insulinase family protein, partial [Acidimicrobiales bacterium]|nr:insulinase family protein [Acidimicrobiales bacterium]